jgi:uncharacterized membrane protein
MDEHMLTPIIILVLLISPLLLGWLVTRVRGGVPNISTYACWGLGLCFLFFGLGHFVQTESLVAMLPPRMPLRLEIVYATGVLEFAIGAALFMPRYQRPAAMLAILVFVAFSPANIHAAMHGIGPGGHQWGPVYLLIRLPLQLILIAWAYFLCLRNAPT